jgi:hypothetical protein
MKQSIILLSVVALIAVSCGQKENNTGNNSNKPIENMKFRASFCDPFKPDIIELGDVEKEKIMELFDSIPWSEHLAKMKTANESEIHYSPSLEVENKDNRNGLSVSAIDGREWYIFYKRPKQIKIFFGLFEKMDENYLTDIQGQTVSDVKNCLDALIRNDLQYLEDKIK